jgi:hypothetical protein
MSVTVALQLYSTARDGVIQGLQRMRFFRPNAQQAARLAVHEPPLLSCSGSTAAAVWLWRCFHSPDINPDYRHAATVCIVLLKNASMQHMLRCLSQAPVESMLRGSAAPTVSLKHTLAALAAIIQASKVKLFQSGWHSTRTHGEGAHV